MISIHLYLVCIYYNLLEFWKLCTSTYTEFSYESLRITPNRKGTRILAIWSVLLSCESFTSYLRINQSVDKHKKKLIELIYGYQRIIYKCLRLTTSWWSVRTSKTNPCMWRGIKELVVLLYFFVSSDLWNIYFISIVGFIVFRIIICRLG